MRSLARYRRLLLVVVAVLLASCSDGTTAGEEPPFAIVSSLNTAIQAAELYYGSTFTFAGIGAARSSSGLVSSIQQTTPELHFNSSGYSRASNDLLFRAFVKRGEGSGLLLAAYAPQEATCWYAFLDHAFARLDGPNSPAVVGVWYTATSTPATGCTVANARSVPRASWVSNVAVGQTSS